MKQREIKFRALRDDMGDCSFVHGCLVYSEDGYPRIQTWFDSAGLMLYTTCIRGTEGQYTGLHDKNGREIYEGDVVITEDRAARNGFAIGHVEMVDGSWRIGGDTTYFKYHIGPWCDRMVVVGNIHENPELPLRLVHITQGGGPLT